MQWCTPTMQLYIIKRQSNRATALEDLTLCIQDIMFWNVSNMLKCNPKKTEFIQFSSHSSPAEPIPSMKVGDCPISLSNEVKNLGVTVHSLLTFKTYINNNCCWPPHVLFISSEKNRKLLSTTERLIHAFVYSKLDYCNSILHGLPFYEVEKLQRLQNTTARLTVRAKESALITSILKSLYWLTLK